MQTVLVVKESLNQSYSLRLLDVSAVFTAMGLLRDLEVVGIIFMALLI